MGQVPNEYIPTPAEVQEALQDADKMNENMRKHGTIDEPKVPAPPGHILHLSEEEIATEELIDAAEAKLAKRKQLIADAVEDGRKLVTVRQIGSIEDIPGADLIKKAMVEGWPVVVKAGEFHVGDLCVFFEVDSYLPMDDARFKFLEKNAINWEDIPGARLKTIRLRKQLSQGLALPVSIFPEITEHLDLLGMYEKYNHLEEIREMNFTGLLGIMKWDKPVNAQLAGMAKGSFPSFLRKSDQERCQNMGAQIFGYEDTHDTVPMDVSKIPEDAILDMIDRGDLLAIGGSVDGPNYYRVRKAQASRDTRYEVTLKMDGSSMTVYRHKYGDEVIEGVCSRNLDLKMEGNDENAFVKMANAGIFEVLRHEKPGIALQGELMGPGIQGNRENFKADRFFVYNVFDINKGEFMNPRERKGLIAELNSIARKNEINVVIEHVPTLHFNVTLEELKISNMEDLLAFAIGPSMNNQVREGVVFKAMDGSHQFKAISNLYLEQTG